MPGIVEYSPKDKAVKIVICGWNIYNLAAKIAEKLINLHAITTEIPSHCSATAPWCMSADVNMISY